MRPAVALAVVVLLLAAGGAAAAATRPTRELLPALVLPDPVRSGSLAVDPQSGFRSDAAEASGFYAGAGSAQAVAQAGRLDGYVLVYSNTSATAWSAHPPVLTAATFVDLFRSARAAEDYLARSRSHLSGYGRPAPAEETLGPVVPLAAPHVGDDAFAVRLEHGLDDRHTFVSLVRFRRGTLLGMALVEAGAAAVADRGARAAAVALDRRIRAVLAAGAAPRVPVPPAPDLGRTGPPTSGPDPKRVALGVSDFRPGATLASASYARNMHALSEYDTYFTSAQLGRTPLRAATAYAELLPTDAAAGAEFASFRYLLAHDRPAVVAAYRRLAPAPLRSAPLAAAEPLRRPAAGEDGVVLRLRFGSVEFVVAALRVGRFVQELELVSAPGRPVAAADLDVLLRRLAARMR